MSVLFRRVMIALGVAFSLGTPLGAQRIIQLDSGLIARTEELRITRPLVSSMGQHRFASYASSRFTGVRMVGRGGRRGGIIRDRHAEYSERRGLRTSENSRSPRRRAS